MSTGAGDDGHLVVEKAETILAADAPYDGPVLEVRDLVVTFPTVDGEVRAVRGVDWDVNPGEVLAIVGESGSGKSVSAMAVMGLLPGSARISGSALFKGIELLGMSTKSLNQIRGRHLAMIFQDPMTSLNPVYRVGWQISEAVLTHRQVGKDEANKRAVELLDLVGIPNARDRADNYPHELSGGMRQRAVIAVAMANDPDVIIADEPTTALDVTVQAQILDALEKAQEETQAAVVLITHDLGVVAGMAQRVNVMYAGRVVENGTADDIYYHARMPYTVGLLGSLPRLDVDGTEKLTPIKGTPPSMLNLPPGCPFSPRCPLAREACIESEPDLLGTETAEHAAACFFWSELSVEGVTPEALFAPDVVDDVDVLAAGVGPAPGRASGPVPGGPPAGDRDEAGPASAGGRADADGTDSE